MSEFNQILLAIAALIPSLFFAFFTAIGGRDFNWLGLRARIWKRVIAPTAFVTLVLVLALIEHRFNWWLCTLYVTYFISGMIGYGSSDSVFSKEIRRTIWSIIRTLACLPLAWLTGSYILIILQAICGIVCTLGLGVWNPLKAPAEEFLINFISVLFVSFMLVT